MQIKYLAQLLSVKPELQSRAELPKQSYNSPTTVLNFSSIANKTKLNISVLHKHFSDELPLTK